MTIRSAISGLLANDHQRSDPAAALEEEGYEGVTPEAFGTALTHFADSSTLAEADALAPVVTRVGPVPLAESDLLETEVDSPTDDAFSLFSDAVADVHLDFGEPDLDDSDLDDINDTGFDTPGIEDTDLSQNDTDEVSNLHFGEPDGDPLSADPYLVDDQLDVDDPHESVNGISAVADSELPAPPEEQDFDDLPVADAAEDDELFDDGIEPGLDD